MCVIIYKPAGVELPAKKILKAAAIANRDGNGFVVPGKMYKSLNFEDFAANVWFYCQKDKPLLMHFRLATQGSVKRANCHPFYDKKTDTYFMHNGVMWAKPYKDKTDSELVFRREFLPIIRQKGIFSQELDEETMMYPGNRFAFMHGEDVQLFGQWYKFGDLLCSNLRFLEYFRFI